MQLTCRLQTASYIHCRPQFQSAAFAFALLYLLAESFIRPLQHLFELKSQQRCLSRPVKAAHFHIAIPGNSALICNGPCAGHTKREDDGVWGMGFK